MKTPTTRTRSKLLRLMALTLLLGVSMLHSAPAGKGKGKAKGRPENPPGQGRKPPVPKTTAWISAGPEKHEVFANPGGYFPVVVLTNSAPVKITVAIPGLADDQDIRITLVTDGELSAAHGLKNEFADQRGKIIHGPLRGNGRFGFTYRFGGLSHNQKIQIVAGQAAASLNLHLHLPDASAAEKKKWQHRSEKGSKPAKGKK